MAKPLPETAFVVLRDTSNHPGKFVVVECALVCKFDNFENPHSVNDDLAAAVNTIPRGRKRYNRNKHDSPQVVETWI